MKTLLFLASLCLILFSSCNAQKKFATKRAQAALTLISQTKTKATAEDIYDADKYIFRAKWNDVKHPITFFWRPNADGWHTTSVIRTSINNTEGAMMLEDIRQGDELTLQPMYGGRNVMPDALKSGPSPAVYYQLSDGSWGYVMVR